MIASFGGMIVLVIRKTDHIENQVIMDMTFVNMRRQDKLIFAAQDFFCKLHADLMRFLRRHFTRFKRLYQVMPHVRSFVNGMAARSGKFNVGGFGSAAVGGNKQATVRFVRIEDIANRRFQR